ncbi:hypothetical protein PInf_021498 [Phytophthora infestans]|nr:hypothetical protein PInf_021498 [Phytophthora infestans]
MVDRRVRREEAKEEAKEEAAPKRTGALVKKKAAKETAAKTARAPAKPRSRVTAASKEADAEVGCTEAKETEPVFSTHDGEEVQSVLADLVTVVGSTEGLATPARLSPLRYLLWFHLALQRANDLQYKFPGSVGVAFSKTTPQKRNHLATKTEETQHPLHLCPKRVLSMEIRI